MLVIIKRKFFAIIFLTIISSYSLASSRKSSIRTFGDYAQIINPLFAASLASQEKGFGHFAAIYAQDFVTMHGIKYISQKSKFNAAKRPFVEGKRDRYDGMPSGHTNSAWVAAAYVRTFSEDRKYFAIPLYISAAVTGYSRVHSKEHTTAQVISGALLAEAFVYVNSKLDWSNDYKSYNFFVGPKESRLSFEFKF